MTVDDIDWLSKLPYTISLLNHGAIGETNGISNTRSGFIVRGVNWTLIQAILTLNCASAKGT